MKFLLLLISVLLVPALVSCDGQKDSNVNTPKRSKRWDAYIQSLKDAHEERRVRRQTGAREWESVRANCDPATYTLRDTLGVTRRRRGANSLLAEPQHQGDCGSCWAFSSIHTLTDQLSLNRGTRQPLLSANHVTLCNKDNDYVGSGNGCCGALSLYAGPLYFFTSGVTTNECSPYGTVVSRYSDNDKKRNIPLPTCPRTCADGSSLTLTSYRNRLRATTLANDEAIINALDAGGVVLAGMFPTYEFSLYQCGVYSDSGTTKRRGGHAIEIVDYGTTLSGTDFWVVKNSWGTNRHENGYFRIARGHLGIARGNARGILLSVSTETNPAFTLPTDTPDFGACSEVEVANPTNDEMVRSTEEFVRQQLISMNLVSCRPGDGGTPTELNLNTIMSADTQVIAGTNVDVDFAATVEGCEQPTTVDISSSVIIDLNENFSLESHTITIRSNSNNNAKNLASLCWSLLVMAAALVIFTVQE